MTLRCFVESSLVDLSLLFQDQSRLKIESIQQFYFLSVDINVIPNRKYPNSLDNVMGNVDNKKRVRYSKRDRDSG